MDSFASVFKGLSLSYLSLYLKTIGLTSYTPDESQNKKTRFEDFQNFYQDKLSQDDKNRIEYDAQQIHLLSSKIGIELLFEKANLDGIKFPEEEMDIINQYDKAVWFYCNKLDFFEEVTAWLVSENKSGWKEVYFPKKPIEKVKGKEEILSKNLKTFLRKKDSTAENCDVRAFEKEGRICYVAYPDGHAGIRQYYENGERKDDKIRKDIENIYFIYDTYTGALATKAKRRNKYIQQMQAIFGDTVLNCAWEEAHNRIINFDVLKDRDFDFPTHDDKVEEVYLKAVTFINEDTNEKISYEIPESKTSGLTAMYQTIDSYSKISIEDDIFKIIYAKFFIRFDVNTFKGKQGKRTFDLRGTNTHILTDGEMDRKIKELLIRWNIFEIKKDGKTTPTVIKD